jgi:hypothetical protein
MPVISMFPRGPRIVSAPQCARRHTLQDVPRLAALACGPVAAALLLGSLGACNPYERHSGEYLAGSVDPIKFPTAYLGNPDDNRPQLGTAGVGKSPGQGTFQYVVGWVAGKPVVYYPLPFNGKQATVSDPLDLNRLKTSLTYVFDPGKKDAPQDSDRCAKPTDYQFDRQRDEARYDRQGNIFTALPTDSDPVGSTTYVPIAKEVVVTSAGNPCQDIKSEATLVKRADVQINLKPAPDGVPNALPSGIPSGRFLAFAIIDPAADVKPPSVDTCMTLTGGDVAGKCKLDPVTGLGPRRWGWYQQYLLGYIDGGYIPIDVIQPVGKLRMGTQNLYYPDTVAIPDPDNPSQTIEGPGDLGLGLDLLDAQRGQDGYSPVCHLYSFTPRDIMNPEKSVADINPSKITDLKQYAYCLQTP